MNVELHRECHPLFLNPKLKGVRPSCEGSLVPEGDSLCQRNSRHNPRALNRAINRRWLRSHLESGIGRGFRRCTVRQWANPERNEPEGNLDQREEIVQRTANFSSVDRAMPSFAGRRRRRKSNEISQRHTRRGRLALKGPSWANAIDPDKTREGPRIRKVTPEEAD